MRISNARILIVDDDRSIADTLDIIFQRVGYDSTVAYSAEAAIHFIGSHQPSLVITDVNMPGMNGLALAKTVRRFYPDCPVLLFSGSADALQLLESAEHALEVLEKPVPPLQMLVKVASLLGQKTPDAFLHI